MRLPFLSRRRDRLRSRGQSLVEFALVLPVLLLVLLVTIDFGRVYLGWVNLQNTVRTAANYAANNANEFATANPATLADYQEIVLQDAAANNCQLRSDAGVNDVADNPTFSGYELGDTATVDLTCRFGIITPVISGILGNLVNVSASSSFPVKSGFVAAGNSGGGGGSPVTASFTCTPTNGAVVLAVQCMDESGGGPTSWTWTVTGPSGFSATSTDRDPFFTLPSAGSYTVSLTADDSLNQPSTLTIGNYITAGSPSAVDFTADRNSGTAPLTVQFTDASTNTPTAWAWDFDDDGTVDSTEQNPTHVFTAAGSYDVRLTVTNAAGTATTMKPNYIAVSVPNCTVPSFTGEKRNNAQGLWSARGFTTTVTNALGAPNGNYTIGFQSISNGSVVPCNSIIEVSDK